MVIVNRQGYLQTRKKKYWWLVKSNTVKYGVINLKHVYLPQKYMGKKVCFKVEVLEE